MKEKAISFCRQLIPMIYADIKTHTRRPFTFKTLGGKNPIPHFSGYSLGEYYTGHIDTGAVLYSRGANGCLNQVTERAMPRYKVGDILYVKEEYYEYGHWGENGKTKTGKRKRKFMPVNPFGNDKDYPIYYADTLPKDIVVLKDRFCPDFGYFWRNSRFMPRRAARLFLRLKGIRAERLQDITPEDVIKEGIKADPYGRLPIQVFADLWDGLNEAREYGWFINPYVFVYIFERIKDYGQA